MLRTWQLFIFKGLKELFRQCYGRADWRFLAIQAVAFLWILCAPLFEGIRMTFNDFVFGGMFVFLGIYVIMPVMLVLLASLSHKPARRS